METETKKLKPISKKKQNKTQRRKYILMIESSSSSEKAKAKEKEKEKSKAKSKAKSKSKVKPILVLEEEKPQEKNLKIMDVIEQEPMLKTQEKEKERLNEKLVDMFEILRKITSSQGEVFKAKAYQKAQETIISYPHDINNEEQLEKLESLPGIGKTMMAKMKEYTSTGTLKFIEREKNNPVLLFTEIYGVGHIKAKDLVNKGIVTLDQLREKQNELLNDKQKIGLKYYEDILKKIPRSEIVEYDKIFSEQFLKVGSSENTKMEIVGSYRRGAASSGDIDVIITSSNKSVFKSFIDGLLERKVIVEVLSRGPTKCLVICKLPDNQYQHFRRVDFLFTSPEEYPFSVLYFTGSKYFNTFMRHRAQTMGYSMNEHGMYKMEGKKKSEQKVAHVFKSEKDIFDFLKMEYKEPHERVDGRAIVIIDTPVMPVMPALESKAEEPFKLKEDVTKLVKPVKKKKIVIEEKAEKEDKAEKKNKEEKEEIVEWIEAFKKNGISVLDTLNEKQLADILDISNEAYRNLNPIMTDNEYDIIQDYVSEKYPSNFVLKQIGAPISGVGEKNKAVLPYEMASMDKIKPDSGALAAWMKKYAGPYVLSCKLDGVSGLYTTEDDVPKLYTRGDGKIGQDISYLIPYLRLPKNKGVVIRGEFILPKLVFETKYKSSFANPRNLVSGIVNRISLDEKVGDLHFVAYEVIKPSSLKPSEQFEFLLTLDVNVVLNKTIKPGELNNDILSQYLVDWRKNYAYEIDGVIVTDDNIYSRKSGNPDHSFAFKMVLSDQIAEAKVVDVIWTPSKDGYLKPRVQIEPVHLGGVKIEYATGFNGAFIQDNKIGIGALIEIIRSGDVIPHIRSVTTPAEHAKMPGVPYKWNETHIDVLLEDISSDAVVREKNITGFFKGISVDGLSSGNIARIINAGYDTIPKIIKMTKADFLKVEGFKEKLATKIHDGIREKLDSASLLKLMSASNIFGRGIGERKMEPILEKYPDILTSLKTNDEKVHMVKGVPGMAKKSAELFVKQIAAFIDFMKDAGLEGKLISENADTGIASNVVNTDNPLYKKNIVMTGFRDEVITNSLKKLGAKISGSVSKNTFLVLAKNKDEDTGKANEARKLNIPILTPDEFKSKYLI